MGKSSAVLKILEHEDDVTINIITPLFRLQRSNATFYKVQSLNSSVSNLHNCFSLNHPRLSSNATVKMITNKSIRKNKYQNGISIKTPF